MQANATDLVFQHAVDGLAVIDGRGRWLRVNPALEELLATPAEALLGTDLVDVLHPDERGAIADALGRIDRGDASHHGQEVRCRRGSGRDGWVDLDLTAAREPDGSLSGFVAQLRPVPEAAPVAHQSAAAASPGHDPVTGLPNRILVLDRVGQALHRADRSGRKAGILLVHVEPREPDLSVADCETVARVVARRLKRAIRATDTAGRLSEQEYVVICEELRDRQESQIVVGRIEQALAEEVPLPRGTATLDAGIGVAVAGSEDDAVTLLRAAHGELIMGERGELVSSYVFDEVLRARAHEQLAMQRELRDALETGALRLDQIDFE